MEIDDNRRQKMLSFRVLETEYETIKKVINVTGDDLSTFIRKSIEKEITHEQLQQAIARQTSLEEDE